MYRIERDRVREREIDRESERERSRECIREREKHHTASSDEERRAGGLAAPHGRSCRRAGGRCKGLGRLGVWLLGVGNRIRV